MQRCKHDLEELVQPLAGDSYFGEDTGGSCVETRSKVREA